MKKNKGFIVFLGFLLKTNYFLQIMGKERVRDEFEFKLRGNKGCVEKKRKSSL